MRKTTSRWQGMLIIATILSCLLVAPMTNALAAPAVKPIDSVISGMTYGDWGAAWWQWVYSIPPSENPLLDFTGENCAAGQSSSPVFYLVGTFADAVPATPEVFEVTRDDCTVPSGKFLFFPVVNVTSDTTRVKGAKPDTFPHSFGTPIGKQRDEAAFLANLIDVNSTYFPFTVTVDGEEVENLADFRAQSPTATYSVPRDNIQGVVSGDYHFTGDGYWVMLEPLSPGAHTIRLQGAFVLDGEVLFALDVTYNLTVE